MNIIMEFTKDIYFNSNPTVNQDLTITYNGFLNNSEELSLVYGYGDSWENTSELKMEKKENGFVGTVNLLNYDTFNFCFKGSNGVWDNNSYCNYITAITPEVNQVNNFDIDSLIEELLFEPIVNIQNTDEEDLVLESTITEEIPLDNDLVLEANVNNSDNLDLNYQLSTILSEVPENNIEFEEYSTLDEILTAQKIENDSSVESIQPLSVPELEENDFSSQNTTEELEKSNENESRTNNQSVFIKEHNEVFDDFLKNLSSITSQHQNIEQNDNNINEQQNVNNEKALTNISDPYIVSSRQVSKLYLFKKRVKLALYKAFVKIPKMLLGIEDKEN